MREFLIGYRILYWVLLAFAIGMLFSDIGDYKWALLGKVLIFGTWGYKWAGGKLRDLKEKQNAEQSGVNTG